VDVILPDIDAQLCRRDSQLAPLADSFVFDALLAERLVESVEKNQLRNRSAVRKASNR